MSKLELRVPPDVVWLVVAAAMWLVSKMTPTLGVSLPIRGGAAALLVAAGAAIIVAARVMLARAGTTWHPTEPERTTALVTGGVFRFSRNPMYLGMLFVLVGWAAVLASPFALLLAVVFPMYLWRFQIRPEERTLSALLGEEYRDYARRVRRWL
jgi:protein-S-isoprenylcysteine O-methyltransferase Ste14